MNISLEKVSNVSAVLTVNMEKADYEENLKKALKTLSQKAQMPGFRPGKVPMGLIKKMYGGQAKAEEVNKLLNDKLFEYINENKINMLGEPLSNEKQQPQDIESQDDFEFIFDIALAPEFSVEATAEDQVDYYDIEVSEEQIDEQVKAIANRAGQPQPVESYEDRDILRGILAELDENGQPVENGIQVDNASLMPAYFKNDEQKKIFENAKKNEVLVFNVSSAYENNETEIASLLKIKKEEAAQHTGDFSFQVEEISRFVPAEMNQELFDQVFGEGTVKSVDEFRAKVKDNIGIQHTADSDYKFLLDVRAHFDQKVGDLQFPDDLLKRIMKANNKDKDEKFVEDNYAKSIEELKWHLIKEQLVKANNIKVDDSDLKAQAIQATRYQFAQYGLNNIPDEYLEQYASEMFKKKEQVNALLERCIDMKLTEALKGIVTLNHKNISVEDFRKMFN